MRLLHTRWFGVVVTQDGRVVERRDFPPDARAIADRLRRVRAGEVLDEEKALAKDGVAVTSPRLRSLGTVVEPRPVELAAAIPASLAREAALLVARDDLRGRTAERDRFLVQAVRALDEIITTTNTLTERLRDWYALHFPEALRAVPDGARLARELAQGADRESLAQRLPGLPSPEDTIGTAFTKPEFGAIEALASSVTSMHTQRSRLETLLESEAKEITPTLASLVGPLIAARLVSLSGGLDRLAAFPASTVQTLGAENALFAHLKEGKPPPKHGVLYQHPLVHGAPRWQRGKVARLLANHASLAARADAQGKAFPDLKERFEARLARVRARPAPPPRPRFRPRPGRLRR